MDWLGDGNSTSPSGNSGQGGRLDNNSPLPVSAQSPSLGLRPLASSPEPSGGGIDFPQHLSPCSICFLPLSPLSTLLPCLICLPTICFPSPVSPLQFFSSPHFCLPLPIPVFSLSASLSPALLLPSIVSFIIYKFPSFSSLCPFSHFSLLISLFITHLSPHLPYVSLLSPGHSLPLARLLDF